MNLEDMSTEALLDGLIGDLGGEENGVQVRGYRNINIIRASVEAAVIIKNRLALEKAEAQERIARLEAEIAELRARLPEEEKKDE